jgi:DNA modification methylase
LTDSSENGGTRVASDESESESYTEFIGDIDPAFEIADRDEILIVSRDQTHLTHGIHKFPAKFFPELPRYLILRFSDPGDVVLDPMCGSGTTVLESLLNGRRGVGTDIDSMAVMITRTKVTPISPVLLDSSSKALSHLIEQSTTDHGLAPKIPEFPYRSKWFKPHVLHELAVIRDCIDDLPTHLRNLDSESWPILSRFLRVLMSSIIRGVSNADPHCTRTVIRKNLVKNVTPGDTVATFLDTMSKQVESMKELWEEHSLQASWDFNVFNADAADMPLDGDSVHLAVTSPPYINAVDYPRTHQLEMYWLGHLGDGPLSHVKREYIGTETVYKDEYSELKHSGLSTLDPLLERIYERDPRRSYIVFRFFQDMEQQLAETWRVLKPGGHYCITIGNNVIRGSHVKSHEILAEMAQARVGFELDRMFFSKLIRHFIRIPRRERMLGEWVLILRKPPL